MARQTGKSRITGTHGNVVFYRIAKWDAFYMRSKSSLSGKRVKNSPEFKKTMFYASLLAQASKIASEIYKQIPLEKRKKGMYNKMVGEVFGRLRGSTVFKL